MSSYRERESAGNNDFGCALEALILAGIIAMVAGGVKDALAPTLVDCGNGRSGTTDLMLPQGQYIEMKPISGDSNIRIEAGQEGVLIFHAKASSVIFKPSSGGEITGGDFNLNPNTSVSFLDRDANYVVSGTAGSNSQTKVEIAATCSTK